MESFEHRVPRESLPPAMRATLERRDEAGPALPRSQVGDLTRSYATGRMQR